MLAGGAADQERQRASWPTPVVAKSEDAGQAFSIKGMARIMASQKETRSGTKGQGGQCE